MSYSKNLCLLEARSKSSSALQYTVKIETSIQQATTDGFTFVFHILLPGNELWKKMKQNIRLCLLLTAVHNRNSCPSIDLPWLAMAWRKEGKIFWYYLSAHSRESNLTGFDPWLSCQVALRPWVHPLWSLCLNLLTFYKWNNDTHSPI